MSYYSLININNNINEHNLKIKFVSPNDHDIFISKTMTSILNNTKKHIETHCDEWNNVKKLTNPYEYIHTQIPNKSSSISKIKPLSRAFFKLIEICKTLEIFRYNSGESLLILIAFL